jgi:hypothetical protein
LRVCELGVSCVCVLEKNGVLEVGWML